MSNKITKEIRNVETYRADTFRLDISKEYVTIEFGKISNNEEDDKIVNVVSSVSLNPRLLHPCIVRILSAAIDYEKKYNEDIGIKSMLNTKNEKEEV